MVEKVLVTGASGLVGSRFVELNSKKFNFITPKFPDLDITNTNSVEKAISNSEPDVVVNFAAFTDVTGAENQRGDKSGSCWKINVEGVKNLDKAINPGVHFIQISTDMVFSGSSEDKGPYEEYRTPELDSSKLTWYGFTKAEAERCLTNRANTAILRIIYPVRAQYELKEDYLKKTLSFFDQGKLYPMFKDQQVSFAYIDEISLAIERIIDDRLSGIFHISSPDISSPFEIASYLIKVARGVDGVVKESYLDDFLKTADNPVRYPKYGGLSVKETENRLGIKFSKWREIINKIYSKKL